MLSTIIPSSSHCTISFLYAGIIVLINDQVCISTLKVTSDIVQHIPYVVLEMSMNMPVDYP